MASHLPPSAPADGAGLQPVPTWRRLAAVAALGVASGSPYMVGTKLLQGWLTTSGIPLGLIGLLAYAELPYTLKMVWAPLLDRWPIPWPDRRRGWLLLLQILLVAVIGAMALLRPGRSQTSLLAIGLMAVLLVWDPKQHEEALLTGLRGRPAQLGDRPVYPDRRTHP
jgi:hypothetical protein